MNTKFWMVLSAALLAVLWIWGGNPSSSDAAPPQGQSNAVIIVCQGQGMPPITSFTVAAFSSSVGTPVITLGSDCAPALASVLAAGFHLENVINASFGSQYTLIK